VLAICLPNRQDLKSLSPHSVIDPIPNAFQIEPPNVRRTGLYYTNADVWLHEQKIESSLQIQAHRSRRCRSIDGPPLNNTLNLASRAPRDVKFKWHS
jgi:hypothetical protein